MSRDRRTTRKPSGRGRKARKTNLLLLLSAAAVVVLAGGYFIAARWSGPADGAASPAGVPPSQAGLPPALTISPTVYDLGQISQAKGIVKIELAVANAGAGDLVIREMETSCGCTRAALVVDGQAGPWFGMRGHGDWPVGWSARLRAGQRATLRVQYDPDAHGIYRGPIDRVVVIYSNDPRQPQAEVRLTGTQVQ